MHACEIAQEVEIPWVIVPRFPGMHSALGLVVTDIVHDLRHSFASRSLSPEALTRAYEALEAQGRQALEEDRVPPSVRLLLRTADVRYRGQSYTVNVPMPGGALDGDALDQMMQTFHAKHEALYTFRSGDEQAELVSLRLRAIGTIPRPDIRSHREGGTSPEDALTGRRPVFFEVAGEFVLCPVYDRSKLLPRNVVVGPAVVEQVDSTIAIPPDMLGTVDQYQNLIVGKEEWHGRV